METIDKTKVLWLDLNASYSHSSLALPMIEAQDREGRIEWSVVNATLSSDVTEVVNQIVEQKPKVLASTAWLFTHDKLHQICRRVKAILPQTIIIYGGPEFMGDNCDYLRINSYVNALVRGEGEEVFYQLLEVIDTPSQWGGISGVCAVVDGEYMDNGTAKVANFAALEYPEKSQFFKLDRPFVLVETTRGCFNNCAFCVSGGDKPLRTLPMEEVTNRLNYFADNGIKRIHLLDRTFNYSKVRTAQFFEIFREFTGQLIFHLEIHPALLSREMMQEIVSMPKGLLHLEAGVQSFDEEVLKHCNRAGEKGAVIEGLKFLCALDNLECHTDLIVGLPHLTLDQTYSDVAQLVSYGAAEIQLESLKLLPGTPLRRDAKNYGIAYSPLPPYEVLMSDHISPQQVREAMTLSKLLDNFYNDSIYCSVITNLILQEVDFLKRFTHSLFDKLSSPLTPSSRGELLFAFCTEHYPKYLPEITTAWISNGLSMKSRVANGVAPYTKEIPQDIKIQKGRVADVTRFYIVTYPDKSIIFGFNRQIEHSYAIFIGDIL